MGTSYDIGFLILYLFFSSAKYLFALMSSSKCALNKPRHSLHYQCYTNKHIKHTQAKYLKGLCIFKVQNFIFSIFFL